MTLSENNIPFQTKVTLARSGSPPIGKRRKARRGDRIALTATFTDFLGEPAKEIGKVSISTSLGSLYIPNGDKKGTGISMDAHEPVLNDHGEMAILFIPGTVQGIAKILLTCDLGSAELEIETAPPPGYAIAEMLESVIYAFLVAIIIRIFLFQTFWIPSGSMEPTLYEKDRIIANKLIYRLREPKREEVVIFRVFQPERGRGRLTFDEAVKTTADWYIGRDDESIPENPASRVEVQDYIKRVVGLPGDVVEIIDSEVYINGEYLVEDVVTRAPTYSHYGPITVPSGEVFVLGDNRANSQDSHVIGTIPIRNIEGRAEAVFWPPGRIQLIPQG